MEKKSKIKTLWEFLFDDKVEVSRWKYYYFNMAFTVLTIRGFYIMYKWFV